MRMIELHTIKQVNQASIKIQRSEFIAFLYPADSLEQIKHIYLAHCKKFGDATHNCYAYILGKKQEIQYYSDQGEPSGTAGKPILNILLKYKLTNVLAIVSRYFGGIKLGVRGLIDAYGEALEKVINASDLHPFVPMKAIGFITTYQHWEYVKRCLTEHDADVQDIQYEADVSGTIVYPDIEDENLPDYIRSLTQSGMLRVYDLGS